MKKGQGSLEIRIGKMEGGGTIYGFIRYYGGACCFGQDEQREWMQKFLTKK